MSENFDELGELGDKIKKIIDTAVSTKDYRQMTEDIKQTVGQTVNSAVNSAVDSGSEAIKNGLNNVFGTGNSHCRESEAGRFVLPCKSPRCYKSGISDNKFCTPEIWIFSGYRKIFF